MNKLLLSLLIPLASLSAQPASGAGSATAKDAHALWTLLDLDGNGVLSAAELAASPIGVGALAIDDDGTVSLSELRHFLVDGRRAVEFGLLFALDANQDGVLQPLEIANAASSLKRLDRNDDGVVSRSEARGTSRLPSRLVARAAAQPPSP
jgi:Ca2+-binding EF-hand superfamily protein